ncbi:MAG: hypothetical protein JNL83_03995 [Myxococcales bacterium]|nr:hypothetical protein [Myxococcales bacterium]
MTVSGLVITFMDTPEAASFALARLHEDARLLLGEPVANRLPIVAETADATSGETLVRELESIAGIARVDVISIDFAEDLDGPA